MPISRKVKGGRKSFFSDPEIDRILPRNCPFMAEHWALKERLLTIEALLAEKNILLAEDIDNYKPSPEQEADWDKQRDEFIRSVMEFGQNVKP